MPHRHEAGNAKVTERLLPGWKLRRRMVERPVAVERGGAAKGNGAEAKTEKVEKVDREPDEATVDAIEGMARRFVDQLEEMGDPAPTVETVTARLRHVLRHADDENQRLVLLSSPTPPYFAVTTGKGRGVEREER